MNKKVLILLIALALSIALINSRKALDFFRAILRPEKIQVVRYFPFSDDASLREWEEKIFKGKVLYRIQRDDHQSFVLGSSEKTASALYYKIKLDMRKKPVISWSWNARRFPLKKGQEDMMDARQDDFAARVYVIFPAMFFTNSKALEYVWTESVPEGTVVASPYSKNLQLIVAECGREKDEIWVSEYRDIYEDYRRAFGEEPGLSVGAVAFMTDADSTGSTAESFYDDIKIGYKEDGKQ